MAKRVQRRRGSTSEHGSFTGAVGEISVDTDKDTVAVHDGSQAGGFPLAREDMNNVTNRVGITQLNCADGSNGQVLSTNGSGTLSFSTVDATTANVGGDLSGTVGNAQIVANAVGTTELAANAVTTAKVTDANITAAKMATNSVTTIKITDANVTTAKIADSAITSVKILDGTIVAGDIASNAITEAKILNANVTTAKIADNAITTALIAGGNVTTNKIADAAVTGPKISLSSQAQGDIMYHNGTTWVRLPSGATGQVLMDAGTSPAWDNAPYDIAFIAGYDKNMTAEDVAVATYGELVMCRGGTFLGESGHITVGPTGAALILDIEKNGTSIYSTRPQWAAGGGAGITNTGTLSTTTFSAGDRITFKIDQIGSSEPGEGVRFTLKCKV
jgi:hypothetical protein